MPRRVEPEWLDSLAPTDERSRRARRDLRLVNRLMGNVSILADALRLAPLPRTIVELGAGDGTLALRLCRKFARHWPRVRLVLVDRAPTVAPSTSGAIEEEGWSVGVVAEDALDWLRSGEAACDIIYANLFLHHFDSIGLRHLLEYVAESCLFFAACEPRRSTVALAGSGMLFALGCNDVTRHDAVVSVRAGFRDGEISGLWPLPGWSLIDRAAGWSSHLFRAQCIGAAK